MEPYFIIYRPIQNHFANRFNLFSPSDGYPYKFRAILMKYGTLTKFGSRTTAIENSSDRSYNAVSWKVRNNWNFFCVKFQSDWSIFATGKVLTTDSTQTNASGQTDRHISSVRTLMLIMKIYVRCRISETPYLSMTSTVKESFHLKCESWENFLYVSARVHNAYILTNIWHIILWSNLTF